MIYLNIWKMTTPTEQITDKPKEEKPIFTFEPVKKKPSRRYRKGSKYDPLLDGFLASKHKLVKVSIKNLKPHYLRTQLTKRIEADSEQPKPKYSNIKVSVINSICYLELK